MSTSSPVHLHFKCPKQWNTMSPAGNGRFCTECKKTVTDFTKVPVTELERAILPEGTDNACGSFYAHQLHRPFGDWRDHIVALYQSVSGKRKHFLRQAALFFITIALMACHSHRRLAGAYAKYSSKNMGKQKDPAAMISPGTGERN